MPAGWVPPPQIPSTAPSWVPQGWTMEEWQAYLASADQSLNQHDPNMGSEYSFGGTGVGTQATPEQLAQFQSNAYVTPPGSDASMYYMPDSGDVMTGYTPEQREAIEREQRDARVQGIGTVAALVGGAAALGATPWGSSAPGGAGAASSGALTPVHPTLGASYLPGGISGITGPGTGTLALSEMLPFPPAAAAMGAQDLGSLISEGMGPQGELAQPNWWQRLSGGLGDALGSGLASGLGSLMPSGGGGSPGMPSAGYSMPQQQFRPAPQPQRPTFLNFQAPSPQAMHAPLPERRTPVDPRAFTGAPMFFQGLGGGLLGALDL